MLNSYDFFKNPKSPTILKRIFGFVTDKDSIVLDFFSGSGTTAQAVFELNKEDEGERKFILVEQLDYVKEKTVQRVKKVLPEGEGFVFTELKSNNQVWIDQILKSEKEKELKVIWKKIQEQAFISYKVELKSIDETIGDFEQMSIEDKKHFLVEVLDKNLLYVNTTDMDNEDFAVTEEEKRLTNLFYSLK
ncbi:site-specific DNA-methyltransferase [Saprospiraceae bacterium]|nr:site-specific DNA-methyltransferase [Saprospiraceae bacterium]